MSKHTEGPWRVHKEKPWIVIMPEPSVLGEGNVYAACGGNKEKNEANARLIAKAPEMLAMLKTAMEHAGKYFHMLNEPRTESFYFHRENCRPHYEALCHEVGKLIAQAEGE